MTADHTPSGDELIVVVDLTGLTGLTGKAEDALPVLELYGPLDTHRLEAALDRIDRATLRPTREPLWLHRLEEHGPGRHTLRLTATTEPDTPVDFPAGLLAGLLTHTPSQGPAGRRLVPTPLQRELIADTDAHPGTGRHSERLAFTWSGPLDLDRFTAAWQSVFDHESVLRTAFEDGPQPYLVQRDRLTPEVVRLSYAGTDWPAAVEKDHHRGIDPRTDGPLRITILTDETPPTPDAPTTTPRAGLPQDSTPNPTESTPNSLAPAPSPSGSAPNPSGSTSNPTGSAPHPTESAPASLHPAPSPSGPPPNPSGSAPKPTETAPNPTDSKAPTHILLTFHHTLLDGWSVRTLLHEFYRAYLADGALPGGERRPDLGDYLRWLADQDTTSAQEFWSGADLAPGTDLPGTTRPAPSGPSHRSSQRPPHVTSTGHTRTRLSTGQAERLYEWAAGLGSPESSVLHAVWALLLYRARGTEGPARIRFHATVSGRGIPFHGIERLPAPLRNPLPVTVDIDPRATLPALLDTLRDQAVDRSAYEWVTAGQARAWSGLRGTPSTGSLLVFENRRYEDDALTRLLAEQGVHVGSAETLGAHTAYPLTLTAQHTDDGALALTASYDPTRLTGADQLLAHTAHLLRRIPAEADHTTTLGHLLELLGNLPQDPPPTPGRTVARAYAEDATAPPLVVLRPATSPGAGTVCLVQTPAARRSTHTHLIRAYQGPEAVALLRPAEVSRLRDAVLRALAEGPVVLGGFSGAGVIAYEVARAVAAFGARAPLVVLTGAETPAADFVRTLEHMVHRTR